MNKIEFPRIGYNGKSRSAATIERWYRKKNRAKIVNVFATITPANKFETDLVTYLKSIVDVSILTKSPQELKDIVDNFNNQTQATVVTHKTNKKDGTIQKTSRTVTFSGYLRCQKGKKLRNKIERAFGYAPQNFKEVMEVINVKTCPYCNMAFTLLAKEKDGKGSKLRFQLDHFYPQSWYPFLAISLYNIIPCCGQCNQSKSAKAVALELHPYHSDIHQLFKFRLAPPKPPYRADWNKLPVLRMMLGMDAEVDNLDIVLQPRSTNKAQKDALSELDRFARLTDQYRRHKDIVQEVFAKRYIKSYYEDPNNFTNMGIAVDPMRLLLGVYPDKKDIEKRPLTKFIQDIWEQANTTQPDFAGLLIDPQKLKYLP